MSNSTLPSIRYVVFHKPGPKWQYGMDFREQDGVREHVQHYLSLHEQGKLELGGPFLLQDAGGMMVATRDVSQEELEAYAAADPAILSGLLLYEVRPWLTVMEHHDGASMK
ncbi:MAG TPA: YciI family protein [Anaerolineales bacterium]|nr:YciI family protein [Anaerolineales bacterium]